MRELVRPIQLILPDGSRRVSDVSVRLPDVGSPPHYEVEIEILGSRFVGESASGAFFALQELRRKLEPRNVLLDCFGARENIYPTPMMQSMGPSLIAIRLDLGHPTKMEDIVDIFDTDGTGEPATVDAQEAYRRKWAESLKTKRGDRSNQE